MRWMLGLLSFIAAFYAVGAWAVPVGERHLITVDPTASLRDAQHRSDVRVTIWYPATQDSIEKRIDIGPPNQPFFVVGSVAEDAAFADAKPRPVILISHGFGGAARMMGWFGVELARAGYVVVAVDHPGNNGLDKMTVAGAVLPWDRAQDLRAALTAASADPAIAPHMDVGRLGVSGFSAGGFTTLISGGARVDLDRFLVFCRGHPTDGVCAPQKEFAITMDESQKALRSSELAVEAAHAGDDHSIPGVRAVFAMAPALVQALSPASLAAMKVPVAIIVGDVDSVAPPDTNGLIAAKTIPDAELKVLPGGGHYDFLSTCTPAGFNNVPVCQAKVSQDQTHKTTINMALDFFNRTLGSP